MKLLFTSDLHLGRTPTRIPAAWRDGLRTLHTWERLVEHACSEKVDALVLGGDVLDESNRFWEALGALQSGAERLHAAGIRLVAVAGNHDAEVLPRLADRLGPERLTLLGRGGVWETLPLPSADQPECLLCGWSFPATHVHQDPVLQWPPPTGTLPLLGLVHGDLGVPNSSYAPLSRERLAALPVAGWLLGHIHAPSCQGTAPWILMPGSPQPLDPGEPGPHHAWMIQIRNGQVSLPSPCLPASLRYDSLTIPLHRPEDAEDAALHEHIQRLADACAGDYLQLRLRLQGSLPLTRAIRDRLQNLHHLELSPRIHIESVEIQLADHPARARAALSPGLTRALEDLSRDPPPADLAAALQDLRNEVANHPVFAGLPPPGPLRDRLTRCRNDLEQHLTHSE